MRSLSLIGILGTFFSTRNDQDEASAISIPEGYGARQQGATDKKTSALSPGTPGQALFWPTRHDSNVGTFA